MTHEIQQYLLQETKLANWEKMLLKIYEMHDKISLGLRPLYRAFGECKK